MNDNRNTIIAVILSGLVLIAWQYFYNMPQMEKRRAEQAQSELVKPAPQPGNATPAQAGAAPSPDANPTVTNQSSSAAPVVSREAAIAASPRIKIDTPRLI